MNTREELEAAADQRRENAFRHVQKHVDAMLEAWRHERGEEPIDMMQSIMREDLAASVQTLALNMILTHGPA